MDYRSGASALLRSWCFKLPGLVVKATPNKAKCSVTLKPQGQKGYWAQATACYPMDCGAGVKSECFPPKVKSMLDEEDMGIGPWN